MANPALSAPPQTQADPKTTAANLVKGIQDKANGKAPDKGQPESVQSVDPNAGKKKYVVEGREIYLTPEDADRYVQKGIAFEPKVTQLNHLQNEMGAFLQTLANDPIKILTDKRIGLTPKSVLEKVLNSPNIDDSFKESIGQWYYDNVVKKLKMTPEELEADENKKKANEYETFKKQIIDTNVLRENQMRIAQAMNQIKSQIAEAMTESGLPNNDTPLGAEMARMVADVMRIAHYQRQAITPKQAIEFVKQRIKSVQQSFYDSLDEENLVKEIGEANAEKIKKHFLKIAKEAGKEPPKNQKTNSSSNQGNRKTINSDDFRDYLNELKKKG